MYKLCIFDLDGTLTDTLESLTYSVNLTLDELGFKQITAEQCRNFVGNGARRLVECSLQAAGDQDLKYIEKAMEFFGKIFKKTCTYHVAPYDGIVELLHCLREQGMQLAVLSNKPHMQTMDVVNMFFEDNLFAHIQGQKEGIPRKPDPTGALMIAEKFKVKPKECVYIGDSDVDMKTGTSAGMTTVGVTWGFRTREILLENGADYTIDRPEELSSIILKNVL